MPEPGSTSLRLRLLPWFTLVALAAVAVFAALTLLSGRSDVQQLVRRQHQALLASSAAAAADAFKAAGAWSAADLRAARAVAVTGGARLEVRDAAGNVVSTPGRGLGMGPGGGMMAAGGTGPTLSAPVTASGATVGTVTLRFASDALPPAESRLRDALSRTAVYGALAATLVALAVGYGVAIGITRPLERLTHAVQRLAAGDRSARANLAAPGELGVLAHEVDRMAAKLEREDELRKALTADVAHELRTPVSILRAHLEAIVDGVEQPTPSLMRSLHEEVLSLGGLIEDLQTLSAAEAAGLQLEAAPVDLAEIARASVELLRPAAEAAEVDLLLETEHATVRGDAARLAQVVRNLVLNALKFTPPGGAVEVTVSRSGERALLRVRDTGAGIPAADLPHVFERFWRGSSAAGTRGSGVGLAVVQELVRAHDGTVRAESSPGQGATFTVELRQAARRPAPRDASGDPSSPSPRSGRATGSPATR